MKLIEATTLGSADFPMAELKDYLRLSSGFTDDSAQDVVLKTCLQAAMGAIEARTGKILIQRNFTWTFNQYNTEGRAMILPVTPVAWLNRFDTFSADGSGTNHATTDFILQADTQRMKLLPKTGRLPSLLPDGYGMLKLSAGYGAWGDVPVGLRQAMLILAARYFENRDTMTSAQGQMPFAVAALLEPFLRVRLGFGS